MIIIHKPTICLDFDGVLNNYHGFDRHDLGEIRPGAEEFLKKLSRNYNVIIFSVRPFPKIVKWLKKHNLDEYVWDVTSRKPVALAYIDDRALRFEGNYEETLKELQGFKPYWKEEKTNDE